MLIEEILNMVRQILLLSSKVELIKSFLDSFHYLEK